MRWFSVSLSLCSLLSAFDFGDGARILAVLPYNARSHFIVMEPLLLALHARGHHLTVVSSFPQKKTLQNYRDVDLSLELPATTSSFTIHAITEAMPHFFKTALFIADLHLECCEKALRNEKILNLLNQTYDLMIGEIFGADCFNYIAHKLNVPHVTWVTSTTVPWASDRMGLPDNPSYIPNYFMDYSPTMTFPQRLYNTFSLLYAKIVYHYYSDISSQKLAEKVFNTTLPPMDEINKQTSLMLVNSHFSLMQSRPFPPNVVEVGGIHIKEVQPLPQDLKKILDNAKDGVIMSSFGSLVRTSSLPQSTIQMLLRVFARLPQTVVFKFEDALEDVPPNVVIRKWLPQGDIIAHPNVRAVITHGGLASTIEAVHFAKPLIGIPFFSDQYQNIKNVVRRGGGAILDIDNLSEKVFYETVKEVLEDPSYAENMKQLSLRFRDRPLTPLQSAVYWTEYVIRHQGAPHLRPASVSLSLYQYLLLDVAAVLLAAAAAFLAIIYFSFKFLFTVICGGRKQSIKKLKTNKSKKIN